MTSFNALRAIANRLTSTPNDELPHQVGYLATSLSSCRDVLQNTSPSNDQSLLLHKLRTRVSALLQDRSAEGRFSGIVIAKALIETGGIAFLSESGSWVRSLISCLNKPDTPEVKKLCVITISRIYLLTIGQQALVREITTPTLPAFISTSLGIIKPSTAQIDDKPTRSLSPLLEVVLRSWNLLIEHFAATFRPSASSIRSVCFSLVSDAGCPHKVSSTAQDLLARLHFCAPKNTVAAEWSQTCSQAIEAAHDAADLVFRAVVEDWSPAVPRISKVTRRQKAASTPATSNIDVLGLDAWSGISQGCAMLVRQVDLLRHFLTNQHAQEINLPIGALFDLTARLTAVTPPTTKFSLRANNEITREEREELWLALPRVHVAVLQLFEAVAKQFGSALLPVWHAIVTQFWDVSEAEFDNETVRRASYDLLNALLPHRLFSIAKSDSANFKRLVQQCCNDLLAQRSRPEDMPSLLNNTATKKQGHSRLLQSSGLYNSAYLLLPTILTYAPLHKLTGYRSIRTQIDQTAILLNHQEAVLASVLHPSRPRTNPQAGRAAVPAPSLMPFLARSAEYVADENHKLASDALLRPRMPVIGLSTETALAAQDEDEEGKEDEEQEEAKEAHEGGYGDVTQPALLGDLNVAMSEPSAQLSAQGTSSSQEGLHNFASARKRDFTTLLEQSANAQLAAPAPNDVPAADGAGQGETTDELIQKRPKTSEEPAQEMPIVIPEDRDQHFPTSWPPATAVAEPIKPFFTPADNLVTSMPLQEPVVSDTVRGKQKVSYDGDDSSDSEVPPIDATLVGMSDSEDEEDD